MSAVAVDEQPKPETFAARISRAFTHGPLNILLLAIGVAWLIPTLGLLFTSLLSPGDFITHGWWQVFRRVTVPLLAPVLSVVFITMLINVLKVFDIIVSIAPGSTQSDASVIAVQMWRQSFGGVNDFGFGSAIAVLLFILVIPMLMLNVRRFRREG